MLETSDMRVKKLVRTVLDLSHKHLGTFVLVYVLLLICLIICNSSSASHLVRQSHIGNLRCMFYVKPTQKKIKLSQQVLT